jgi:hypothetical protein
MNIPPGMPSRCAASPSALRPAHPPDRNSFFRHPKHNKATAQVRPDLSDVPAARLAAPQTPPGIHGPPRSLAGRSPRISLPRKASRCAAESGPRPHACPLRSSAALRRLTSSAQSTRLPGFLPASRTPHGSTPASCDPPKFRVRHSPMNVPVGKRPRWSVFPAPRPLACPPGNIAAVRHQEEQGTCLPPLDWTCAFAVPAHTHTTTSTLRIRIWISVFQAFHFVKNLDRLSPPNLLPVPGNLNPLFLACGRHCACPNSLEALHEKGSAAPLRPIISSRDFPG